MKSTLSDTGKQPTLAFPKLMQSRVTKAVVLFSEPRKGTVVHGNSTLLGGIGTFCDYWTMEQFEDFNGWSVTLSNEV